MDDIRYAELQFLQGLTNRSIEHFNCQDERQKRIAANIATDYYELGIALAEDSYIRFENQDCQLLAGRLRGEVNPQSNLRDHLGHHQWDNPRSALASLLSMSPLQSIRITYRGLRRIKELRDLLRHERILEDFGVLLSIRYFRRDFQDALQRTSDVSVSVPYADMDDFGKINKQHGQAAGDVVMKAYLEVVRGKLGLLGEAYRGVGDEVAAIVIGQGHQRAVELGEAIRKGVESLHCEYRGVTLPRVTASIGVATTPPEERKFEVETLAESRKRQAKEKGKNRVVAS